MPARAHTHGIAFRPSTLDGDIEDGSPTGNRPLHTQISGRDVPNASVGDNPGEEEAPIRPRHGTTAWWNEAERHRHLHGAISASRRSAHVHRVDGTCRCDCHKEGQGPGIGRYERCPGCDMAAIWDSCRRERRNVSNIVATGASKRQPIRKEEQNAPN